VKDLILIGIVLFIIVALFGDGGLEISPELSPELSAALDINYAPDRSVETTTTTIEQQIVGDYVEHQTVVVQPAQPAAAVAMPSGGGGGATIANGRPAGECFLVPGDVVVIQGSNGECQVINSGQRYFVSPAGTRSWLGAESAEPTAVQAPQAPATTADDRWAALVPLDELDTEQLKAAYLRNGGKLPFGFRLWTNEEQRNYLAARAESWR
jgi:hypothetical protein